jgi:ribonuclease HI
MFALSKALQWATKRDMPQVDIYTDSDIVYKWANGLSTLRNPGMIRLANICSKLGEVMPFRVTWVGRGEERQAFTDYIAKLGLHQDIVLSTAKQHALILGGYYA